MIWDIKKRFIKPIFVLGGGSKPVCDDSWEAADGEVVCKQLGFFGLVSSHVHSLPTLLLSQVRVTKEAQFGAVSGGGSDYAMDNVGCSGTEERLSDCAFSGSDDGGPEEVAGVVCDTRWGAPRNTCETKTVQDPGRNRDRETDGIQVF